MRGEEIWLMPKEDMKLFPNVRWYRWRYAPAFRVNINIKEDFNISSTSLLIFLLRSTNMEFRIIISVVHPSDVPLGHNTLSFGIQSSYIDGASLQLLMAKFLGRHTPGNPEIEILRRKRFNAVCAEIYSLNSFKILN